MRSVSHTKRNAAVVVVLAILALAAVYRFQSGPSGSGLTQSWVDQQTEAWKPAQNSTIGFGVADTIASYGNIASFSQQVLASDVSSLASTGAGCIRVDIGFAPWLQGSQAQIAAVDSVVSSIRAAGKCLIIADASSETYRHHPIPWSQFKQAWVERVGTLAARYRPDYYLVVKEPGWYSPMVSDAGTNPAYADPSDWAALVSNLTEAVKQASPSTAVGVSIDAGGGFSDHPQFYDSFLNDVRSSIIGFDIYSPDGFTNAEAYLSRYGASGRQVWIAEYWTTAFSPYDPSRIPLDKSFQLHMNYFAQKVNASMVIPFFTNCFFAYTDQPSIGDLGQRTPVYSEFSTLAQQHGG